MFRRIIEGFASLSWRKDLKEGVALYNKGLFQEAMERFQREVSRHNKPLNLHSALNAFYLGMCHLNIGVLAFYTGDFSNSENHLERAVQTFPENHRPYYYLGMVKNNLGLYAEAMQAFLKVEQIYPDFLMVKNRMAIVFYNVEKYQEALEELEKVVADQPGWADMHYHLGMVYASLGRLHEAVPELSQAIVINPFYFKPRLILAHVYGRLGRVEEAEALLAELIEKYPAYPDVVFAYGLLKASAGLLSEAGDLFLRALEINPHYKHARLQLALALGLEGRTREALEQLNIILEQDPDNDEALLMLGQMRDKETDGQEEKKTQTLKRLLSQASGRLPFQVDFVPDFLDIIKLFSPTRDQVLYQALISVLKKSADQLPDHADIHNHLGALYSRMEKNDQAVESFQRAVAANPRYVNARVNLYRAYLNSAQEEKALAEIDQLESMKVVFPDVLLDKAAILSRLKREEEALSAARRAVNLNPRMSQAYWVWADLEEKRGQARQAIEILERFLVLGGEPKAAERFKDRIKKLKTQG
ncbi:MAG: tetratricopeptide repeat protein [Thermodesulfobacteriota bacterium]